MTIAPLDSEAPDGGQRSERSESALRIYAVVLGVGVLCSLAIVTTFELTRPIISANRIKQRDTAIRHVMPRAISVVAFEFDSARGEFRSVPEEADTDRLVFAGFSESGELVGFALGAQGMGYQDNLVLLYGYEPTEQWVNGIRILESRETPGLGDRIERDPAFLSNFERLDVRVDDDVDALLHEIEFVKLGEKRDPWQIDGITGATVSSRAIAEILNRSTSIWVPRIRRSLSDFRLSGKEDRSR